MIQFYRKVRQAPQVLHDAKILMKRFEILQKEVDFLNRVREENSIISKAAHLVCPMYMEGDYYEFGVYQGSTLIQAYRAFANLYERIVNTNDQVLRSQENCERASRIWRQMRFFAFDSFQGLPKLEGSDLESDEFFAGQFSIKKSQVEVNLSAANCPLDRFTFIEGWFEDTCTEQTRQSHQMKKAAVINIDCDLYSSTKVVLKFIRPLLQKGTVLIFDDWYSNGGNPDLGEQKAFGEMLAGETEWKFVEFQKEGPWRNSFICFPK